MTYATLNTVEHNLQKIQLCITALLNDETGQLLDSQRETVEGLNYAVGDLTRLWIPIERYQQLPADEQSRWRHDLVNPMNGLMGLTELMMHEYLSEHHHYCLYEINRLTKHLYADVKALCPVPTQ